ncbi:MAG: DUF2238 domain-containing protein [Nanoarchaeota archaeon]
MKKESKEDKGSFLTVFVKLLVLFLLGVLIVFFIVDVYEVSIAYSIVLAFISLVLFHLFWKNGFFNFLLVALMAMFTFICTEISFDLNLYVIFLISFFLAFIFGLIYNRFESRGTYAWLLLIGFVVLWIILAFNVLYRDDWLLENYLTIPFVILLLIASKWFKFSKTSYSLIFIYMTLHVIGSHYTYSEVPFGFWLQNFFGLDRNHYDRIIHFSFGFLLAYPVREVFIRIGNYKGIWALFAPIMLVFGLSCVYELVEWWVAVKFGGDLGVAYLGTQGDVWDAQKDMFNAGVGSIIAMAITAIIIFSYRRREYWSELKDSFRVHRGELGEVALQRFSRKK